MSSSAGEDEMRSELPAGSVPPDRLVHLVRSSGGVHVHQPGIDWPTDRWVRRFPQHADLVRSLPNPLDRSAVRSVVSDQVVADDVECAFVVAMIWGYGNVGYGPYRTERVLHSNPQAASCLRAALGPDPLVGYRWLSGDGRLRWLGPAFGTKWLYFASTPRALILDRVVAAWLRSHAGCRWNAVPWSASTYQAYLMQMDAWAAALGLEPDLIEQLIFMDESERTGSQRSPARRAP